MIVIDVAYVVDKVNPQKNDDDDVHVTYVVTRACGLGDAHRRMMMMLMWPR